MAGVRGAVDGAPQVRFDNNRYRPQAGNRDVALHREAARDVLDHQLADAVGVRRLHRVRLIDRQVLGREVGAHLPDSGRGDARRQHHLADARLPGGLDRVPRAHHVGAEVRLRLRGNAEIDAGEMDDRVLAGHGRADGVEVEHVAFDERDVLHRRREVEDGDLVVVDERTDDVPAHAPARLGDQDAPAARLAVEVENRQLRERLRHLQLQVQSLT